MPDSSTPKPPSDGQDSVQEVMGGFPRHLTTQLIEDDGVRRSRNSTWAGLLLGAGLAALALAFPQEALLGRGPGLVSAWSQETAPAGAHVAHWLVAFAAQVSGMRLEPAAFLVSAVLYGACLPLLLSFGRSIGVSTANALAMTLALLLSPAAWLAATTPGPEALGMAAGIALLMVMWRSCSTGYTVLRLGLALLCFAVLCDSSKSFAWLLPALALAPLLRSEDLEPATPKLRVTVFAVLAAGIVFVPSCWLHSNTRASQGELLSITENLSSMTRGALALPALGLGLIGLVALALERRNESEQRPPLWLAAWAAIPVLGFLLIDPAHEVPVFHLLPLAALGGFDLLQRRADDLEPWVLPSIVVAALGLLLGSLTWVGSVDPLAEWRAHARLVLEPEDLLVTDDPQHAYLLGERWGLEVLRLPPGAAGETSLELGSALAREASRRLVLDGEPSSFPPLASKLPRLRDLEVAGE